ncbi:MAG: hypothetical protein KAT34_22225 [Candidatus Aminicenantes bacterium]|nr:hypothetical protein [Candidatus Aminicenantes bacterium]
MDQLINNIKSVPGVVGIAIFKDDGGLVAFDFPEAYDKNLLNLVGLKFQPLKDILPEDEGEIVYLCWEFDNLLGFYYPVEGGWINIISSDDIPMPALSLTMNAVANKLPNLLSSAAVVQDQAVVEKTVTPERIKEMEKIFSLYLGPATHVILKRAAHQLGCTPNNIPENKLGEVVEIVIAKVPESKKDEVIKKVGNN